MNKQEKFNNKIKDKGYICLDYKNNKELCLVKHISCGHVYQVKPLTILKPFKCPICENGAVKNDSIMRLMIELEDYTVLEKYIPNTKTKIHIKHNLCNHEFEMMFDRFKAGCRCPKCAIKRRVKKTRLGKTNIIERINENYPDYEILTELTDSVTVHDIITVKHNCDVCKNHIFDIRIRHLLYEKNNCPKCSSLQKSKGESYIEEYLISNNFKYETYKKFKGLKGIKGKNLVSFDFCVYKENEMLLIEFDGRFHREPYSNKKEHIERFNDQKANDEIKTKYCEDNNIPLLRITSVNKNVITKQLKDFLH